MPPSEHSVAFEGSFSGSPRASAVASADGAAAAAVVNGTSEVHAASEVNRSSKPEQAATHAAAAITKHLGEANKWALCPVTQVRSSQVASSASQDLRLMRQRLSGVCMPALSLCFDTPTTLGWPINEPKSLQMMRAFTFTQAGNALYVWLILNWIHGVYWRKPNHDLLVKAIHLLPY